MSLWTLIAVFQQPKFNQYILNINQNDKILLNNNQGAALPAVYVELSINDLALGYPKKQPIAEAVQLPVSHHVVTYTNLPHLLVAM